VAQRREMLLERFRAEASRAFLDAYREVVLATPHAWLDPYANEPLMMLFLIEKAASDVYHEQLHHPAWLGVPLRGLSTLARRLVPPTEEDDDSEA
jgi:maltose alpha-D-glucosyltransferase/alpha-amylase